MSDTMKSFFKLKMNNTHCSLLVLLISVHAAIQLRRSVFPFVSLCSLYQITFLSFICLQGVSRMSCFITLAGWSICTFPDPHSGPFWKSEISSFPVSRDLCQWPWPFKGSWEWPPSCLNNPGTSCQVLWAWVYPLCIQVPYPGPHPLTVSFPCSRFCFWFLILLKANLTRKNQGKCGICVPAFSVSCVTRSPAPFSGKPSFFLIFLPIEALPVDLHTFSENQLTCEFLTLIPGALTVSLYSTWVPIYANWRQLSFVPFYFTYFHKLRPYQVYEYETLFLSWFIRILTSLAALGKNWIFCFTQLVLFGSSKMVFLLSETVKNDVMRASKKSYHRKILLFCLS